MTGHRHDLLLVRVHLDAALDQPQAAQDRGEEVVEIVGDAACQLADRIHLARLDELVLQILAIGHVEQGAGIFRSEEHTSELQSLMRISYAVFCLKKKKN